MHTVSQRLVVGVIGHVDHGKTALVRTLTGIDTDRLAEEKQRGISIALGFAHYREDDLAIDLIDMPGHERFVRTMIAGATGIDAVLLVVAANEGIKPQTVEHVDIAGLCGLRRALVVISKRDLVDAAQLARVADEAMQLLTQAGFTPLPPVTTSALHNEGFVELRNALRTLATQQTPRGDGGIAWLPIDRAFSIAGHGPVVTGTLRGAPVTSGDALELLPAQRTVRVRSVQVHGQGVETARPGQRVALNLRDVEIAELQHGMALAAPDLVAPSPWPAIAVRAVAGTPALKNGTVLRALLGTSEVDVRLRLLDRDVLDAGESAYAQLHCAAPVAVPVGEHVILRLPSPARTVAGGPILDVAPRRLRRHCPTLLQRLGDLHRLPLADKLASEVQRVGAAGTTVRELAQLCALSPPRTSELLQALPVVLTRTGTVVWRVDLEQLLARIPVTLELHAAEQSQGLTREQLRAALPGTGAAVLDAALGRLIGHGALQERGSRLMIPRPDQDRAQARSESELAAQLAELLRSAGLMPPNPDSLQTSVSAKRALDRLLRDGVIVRAVDRAKHKELLFHRDALADARVRLTPLLAPPGLLVSEIGAALGVSRKYTMPLLDHFDASGFTKRVDDRRVLG